MEFKIDIFKYLSKHSLQNSKVWNKSRIYEYRFIILNMNLIQVLLNTNRFRIGVSIQKAKIF